METVAYPHRLKHTISAETDGNVYDSIRLDVYDDHQLGLEELRLLIILNIGA